MILNLNCIELDFLLLIVFSSASAAVNITKQGFSHSPFSASSAFHFKLQTFVFISFVQYRYYIHRYVHACYVYSILHLFYR